MHHNIKITVRTPLVQSVYDIFLIAVEPFHPFLCPCLLLIPHLITDGFGDFCHYRPTLVFFYHIKFLHNLGLLTQRRLGLWRLSCMVLIHVYDLILSSWNYHNQHNLKGRGIDICIVYVCQLLLYWQQMHLINWCFNLGAVCRSTSMHIVHPLCTNLRQAQSYGTVTTTW